MASTRTHEIEADLERTRRHLDETLFRLKEQLSPGQLVDQAVGLMRERRGDAYLRRLGETVRDNPIPVMLLAVSLAWLMVASSRRHDRETAIPRRRALVPRETAPGVLQEPAGATVRGARPAPVQVQPDAGPAEPVRAPERTGDPARVSAAGEVRGMETGEVRHRSPVAAAAGVTPVPPATPPRPTSPIRTEEKVS
jgi:hypothetical protein